MNRESSPQVETARKPLVILVLEDDFMTRWAASEFLRDAGHRVIESENVAAAMSLFETGLRPDIVFSDVNMPGDSDGHRFSAWLAAAHPTIPMILTSAASAEAARAVPGALRRFVRKPYDLNAIASLILIMRALAPTHACR